MLVLLFQPVIAEEARQEPPGGVVLSMASSAEDEGQERRIRSGS